MTSLPNCKPSVGPSAKNKVKGTPVQIPRCRLAVVCNATPRDLAIRRIRVEGAVMPTLCCPACAAGREPSSSGR